ncbi:MAG: YggT family protein [Chromatiales bacterium]|nr:YggT family protein [Chromatiales bacterium]
MQSALIFILRTLFDLYVLVFVLRLLMQWTRVDTRNPFVQFILRVTNPLVMPLRRLLPPIGRLDSATLMALLGLQMLGTAVLVQVGCIGRPGVVPILLITVLGIVRLILTVYFWTIIIYAVLSWVSPGGYNPGAALVSSLAEPLLRPVQRVIPLIGGIDLSPIFVLIALQALMMVLPTRQLWSAMLCANSIVPVL